MKVAEIIITSGSFARDHLMCAVAFDSAEKAKTEYERIEVLLKKRADKGNDLPKWLEVEGITKGIVEFDHIVAVALVDFATVNEHEQGVRETFPYIKWRS